MLDQELLAKAEANDVQAIFEVAKAYYIGDGVEENNDKAFELFSKVVALDPNFQMCTVVLVDATKRAGVLLRI